MVDFPTLCLTVKVIIDTSKRCLAKSTADSELLRVAYCEGARYVTSMIIPVFAIM
jgi:hypothetical protein